MCGVGGVSSFPHDSSYCRRPARLLNYFLPFSSSINSCRNLASEYDRAEMLTKNNQIIVMLTKNNQIIPFSGMSWSQHHSGHTPSAGPASADPRPRPAWQSWRSSASGNCLQQRTCLMWYFHCMRSPNLQDISIWSKRCQYAISSTLSCRLSVPVRSHCIAVRTAYVC